MALGLTRDSYAQLSSLSSTDNEDKVESLSYRTTEPPRVGDSTIVSLIDKEQDKQLSSDTSETSRVGDSTEVSVGDDEADVRKQSLDRSGSQSSQSTSSRTPESSSYGDYSGFAMDYAEYQYDGYNDPYAPTLLGHERGKKNVFCCLFPWMDATDTKTTSDDDESSSVPSAPSADESVPSDDGGIVIDAANVPDMPALDEKVITETVVVDHPTSTVPKSSKNGDDDENSTGSDILGDKLTERERSAVLARLRLSQPDTPLMSDPPTSTGKGLLDDIPPVEEEKKQERKGILKRGSASSKKPNASQVRNKTLRGDMVPPGQRRSLFPVYLKEEKKKVDTRRLSFAPMARVVTVKSRKNMTYAEKSEIWWQKSDYDDFKKTGRLVAKAMLQGGSEVWLMTNKSWQSPGTKSAILNNSSSPTNGKSGESKEEDLDNKWWHKFGHSRRGLEHIASMEEGKQRQMNVRVAVRAVLDDQRKQRMYGKNDPEKTRSVYSQFSSWARELAVAAGASDAEAVTSNFSEDRHSREFYLLKHRVKSGGVTPGHVPDFMKPEMTSPQALDANTKTQLRMQRHKMAAQTTEAIHDPFPQSGKSIAKKAAGFGTADENVSMAAVLSGMGTVGANPTRTRSVGAH